jgi:hypothetical protein
MRQEFRCPRCGTANNIGQRVCQNCGQGFQYNCPYCKASVDDRFSTCPNCHTPLNWPTQQTQPQSSAYQQKQTQNYGSTEKGNYDLLRCPQCKKKRTLQFNNYTGLYECSRCKRKFTISEITSKRAPISPKWAKKPRKTKQYKGNVRINAKTIFSTLQKILIFASIIVITAIIITSVCMFISSTLQVYALVGVLILGSIFLGLCLHSLARRRLTFTRFFLVFLFSVIFIILSASYLDLRTPDDIKNNISSAFSIPEGQFRENIDLIVQRTELKTVEADNIDDKSAPAQTTPPSETAPNVPDINTQKSSEHYVLVRGAILVGADGHCITIKNNPNAVDPSWEQLKSFLLKDNTDQIPYDFGKFVCADFAERLHNNAELAGIKAAYVCVYLGPCSYYLTGGGHALNAFQTNDRGLIYIDCTGFKPGINADKIVDVTVGKEYIPQSIFPQPGWSSIWGDMGKVEDIETIEW